MGKYAVIKYTPYPTFQLRGIDDNGLQTLYRGFDRRILVYG